MSPYRPRRRLLMLVVAFNAERFIESVLYRIPQCLNELYQSEILVIDDASSDSTFKIAVETHLQEGFPFALTVLTNPVALGYGGTQKLGCWYAIENDFDYVALIHGDGKYASEYLPALLAPLDTDEADIVIGSRMLNARSALRGMPFYKFAGNEILSWLQNKILGTTLGEFHSGYRIYSVEALRKVPFALNSQGLLFDTEIILQFLIAQQRIAELPIPGYHGEDIPPGKAVRLALRVLEETLKTRTQDINLYYDRKYDCAPGASSNKYYKPKLAYRSPHSLALEAIPPNSRVLDLGCAGGYMGEALKSQKCCSVTGVDVFPLADHIELDSFIGHDLNSGPPDIDLSEYDYILLLDVIEHLKSPEHFVTLMRERMHPDSRLIVSTANIAFFITRFNLLLGSFNYGKRGILDLTHLRLFTFASIINLFKQANFQIQHVAGIPIPFPLVFGYNSFSDFLLAINNVLLRLFQSFFSYQVFLVAKPLPTLTYLSEAAKKETAIRLSHQMSGDLEPLLGSSLDKL